MHFAQNIDLTNVGFVGPLTTPKVTRFMSEGHAIHEVLVSRSKSCLRLYAVLDHVEKNTITVSDFLDVARASFFKGNGGLHSK